MDVHASTEPEQQYLFCRLGDDEIGLALHHVREIVRYVEPTRVPGSPPWLRGVFNLRGKVLPVIDLGVRLGMPSVAPGKRTTMLVLDLELGLTAPLPMAIVVDAVHRVDGVAADAVQPPPQFGLRIDVRHLVGLLRRGNGMVPLVDIVRAFRDDELLAAAQLEARAAAAPPPPRIVAPPQPREPDPAMPAATEFAEGIFLFE